MIALLEAMTLQTQAMTLQTQVMTLQTQVVFALSIEPRQAMTVLCVPVMTLLFVPVNQYNL